eukprot:TRINITY_DN67_c0_g1_i4.p2 TRINITY_DN67_c0_g1~~TRINITY_DN67_c0_g1_i4.p2  ORF type:complete len:104 (+),score=34.44 TRINITY_DN67_c0_g1_i4:83-394(+)
MCIRDRWYQRRVHGIINNLKKMIKGLIFFAFVCLIFIVHAEVDQDKVIIDTMLSSKEVTVKVGDKEEKKKVPVQCNSFYITFPFDTDKLSTCLLYTSPSPRDS